MTRVSMTDSTVDGNRVIPKIFVIDDDEAVRLAISMLIESCGWLAFPLATAEEFLSIRIPTDEVCCLILDLNMPGMNGADLVELLSKQKRWLPVIAVTGFAESALAARARAAGVRAVLKKPFSDQLLLDHVREALSLPV